MFDCTCTTAPLHTTPLHIAPLHHLHHYTNAPLHQYILYFLQFTYPTFRQTPLIVDVTAITHLSTIWIKRLRRTKKVYAHFCINKLRQVRNNNRKGDLERYIYIFVQQTALQAPRASSVIQPLRRCNHQRALVTVYS